MKDDDFITRREVELVLLEKGQRSRRYGLGEVWELNFDEIREALSEYQQKIVRCKDCKSCFERNGMYFCGRIFPDRNELVDKDWFCANGERRWSGIDSD